MRVTVIDESGNERKISAALAADKNYLASMGLTVKEKPKATPKAEKKEAPAKKKPAAKKTKK